MKKQPILEQGGIYHIFNHANGRENVFESPENYDYFLLKYAEKLEPVVLTLAYCLMPNHFHILIKVKSEDVLLNFLKKKSKYINTLIPEGLEGAGLFHHIVHRQFHNFLGGYSKAFNKYHGRAGSLLRQNTQRKIVADKDYVMNAIRYLHLNPVYHGFTDTPEDWPHSSYLTFLTDVETTIPREGIIGIFGGKESFVRFHMEKLKGGLDDQMER
jgi:REP element-mobilizing transposase RayT